LRLRLSFLVSYIPFFISFFKGIIKVLRGGVGFRVGSAPSHHRRSCLRELRLAVCRPLELCERAALADCGAWGGGVYKKDEVEKGE
jgi:hypothetical protein